MTRSARGGTSGALAVGAATVLVPNFEGSKSKLEPKFIIPFSLLADTTYTREAGPGQTGRQREADDAACPDRLVPGGEAALLALVSFG